MHQRVLAHLALLDTEIAKGAGAWLLGEQPSVCDYYLAACVRWAQLYPRGDTLSPSDIEKFPALTGLLQTLEARPEVQKAYAAEGMYGKVFTHPDYPTQAVV
jgi:glutathione S-transferase